jgi:CheY-like chemotaxis protein
MNKLRGKIMIVDDEDVVRELLSDMLTSLGFDVTDFADPAKAVEYYRKEYESVDMVFLDMTMPKLNGRETFFLLKKINREIKSIVLSGFSMNDDIEQMIKEGCFAYLKKPVKIQDLEKILGSCINKGETEIKHNTSEDIIKMIDIPDAGIKEALENAGNSEIFIRMIGRYVENYCDAGEKMKRFADNRNCEELFIFSHSIKSVVAGLGLNDLKIIASEIEKSCREKDSNEVFNNIEKFIEINRKVCSKFQDFLSVMPSVEKKEEILKGTVEKNELLSNIDEMIKYSQKCRPVAAMKLFDLKLKKIDMKEFTSENRNEISKMLSRYDFDKLEKYLKNLKENINNGGRHG